MEYCKYHPLRPATYACSECQVKTCDACIDEGDHRDSERCFVCGAAVTSLGARYSAEPFWRRLNDSFYYPVNTETIILIVVVGLFSAVIPYLPFALLWYLLLTGTFMKYCFSCLENTASGSMTAPDITAAYGGGLSLALQLLAMLAIMGGSVFGAFIWLGQGAASLLTIFIICSLPAMLINFALTENLLDAINPLKVTYLISSVGLPYGLLLMLIMVMLGSISVISQLIGNSFSFFAISLQSIVSNYYMIVIFHIMGYMIFQYQGQLGFIAEADDGSKSQNRSVLDRLLANIDVMVKEGDYPRALLLFQKVVKEHPDEQSIYPKCFEFLMATKQLEPLKEFAIRYFRFLKTIQREDKLLLALKSLQELIPDYMPQTAADRYWLAKVCYNNDNSQVAVRLLNGIHKSFPDYPGLAYAYELMADALRSLGKVDKAKHSLVIANHFKQQLAKKAQVQKKAARHAPLSFEKEAAEQKPSDTNGVNYDGGIDFK